MPSQLHHKTLCVRSILLYGVLYGFFPLLCKCNSLENMFAANMIVAKKWRKKVAANQSWTLYAYTIYAYVFEYHRGLSHIWYTRAITYFINIHTFCVICLCQICFSLSLLLGPFVFLFHWKLNDCFIALFTAWCTLTRTAHAAPPPFCVGKRVRQI